MRLVDILVLHYEDASRALSESVKKSVSDNNVARLLDTKRYKALKETLYKHGLASGVIAFLKSHDVEDIVLECRDALFNDNTESLSPTGLIAYLHPADFGRDYRTVSVSKPERVDELVVALNKAASYASKACWVVTEGGIVSGDVTLYLDRRYGWYHNDLDNANLIENRILPLVNREWDKLTQHDYQTLFADGTVKPVTKVRKGSVGYEFVERSSSRTGFPAKVKASTPGADTRRSG